MRKKRYPTFIVKGRDNIVISGTKNYYNRTNGFEAHQVLMEKIKGLENVINEKEQQIKDRDALIRALLDKIREGCQQK